MLRLGGLSELSKGLLAAASKAPMKSTPILLGSALLEEISVSGFKSQAWSLGKKLMNNDGVKGFLSMGSARIFPTESGLALQSRWI